MRHVALRVMASLVCGCVTQLPLPKYQGNAEVQSQRTAEITLVHGVMLVKREGPTFGVGGSVVTVPGGWNANDQQYIVYYRQQHRDFISAFCAELERLGIFRKADIVAELPALPTPLTYTNASSKTSDAYITIQYVTSSYDNTDMNAYTLDVVLTAGSDKAFVRKYHIESNKGETFWTKLNTSAPQARQRVDTQLMDALIRDVQVWLREDTAAR